MNTDRVQDRLIDLDKVLASKFKGKKLPRFVVSFFKRFIHQEADCIALRGYNSILVGPQSLIFNMQQTKNMNRIISAGSLPANPYDGMLVALTEDYVVDETTYEAGTVYEYSETNDSWSEYQGLTVA